MAKPKFHDFTPGEVMVCDGPCEVTFMEKTGKRARLRIVTDSNVEFKKPAQTCHVSTEGEKHATDNIRN